MTTENTTAEAKKQILAYLNNLPHQPDTYRDSAYLLTYYAAIPATFTVDMLYQLWLNFSQYTKGNNKQEIQIVSIADFLYSNICHKIGYELYEIDKEVAVYLRTVRPEELQEKRQISLPLDIKKEITEFVLAYADKYCNNTKYKNLHDVYHNTLLWKVNSEEALRRLKNLLSEEKNQNKKTFHSLNLMLERIIEMQSYPSSEIEYKERPVLSGSPEGKESYEITEYLKQDEELWENVLQVIGGQVFDRKIQVQKLIEDNLNAKNPVLDLSRLGIENIEQELAPIFEYQHLTKLYLQENKITHFPFELLDRLPNLKEIQFYGNPMENLPREIFDFEGNCLDKLKKLLKNQNYEIFSLIKNNIREKETSLRLHSNNVSDEYFLETSRILIEYAPLLSHVKELAINGLAMKDISFLENFTQLEKLDLSWSGVPDIYHLRWCKRLKYLNLLNSSVTHNINVISELDSLEHLQIQTRGIDSFELEYEGNLKSLDIPKWSGFKRINLKGFNNLENFSLLQTVKDVKLSGFNKLKKFEFGRHLRTTDSVVLDGFNELEDLNLYNEGIKILELHGFSSLKILNLSENNINQFNLEFLNKFTNLKELYLQGNPIENLPKEVFNFNGNCLDFINEYIDIFKLLNASFSSSDFESFCFIHFEEVHKNFTHQMSQSIRIRLLVEYVRKNGKMEELLSLVKEDNNIEYKKFESTEYYLDLSNQNITNLDGIEELKGATYLEILHLEDNQITHFPADLLDKLPNLKELYLQGNPIENLPKEIFDFEGNCLEQVKTYLASLQQQTQKFQQFTPETEKPQNYTQTINGVSFEMIWVEGGEFLFQDRVKITLEGFYMAKYPVTQELYVAVMAENPSHFKENPQNPVESVSWNAAQTFIEKLNEFLPPGGRGLYRLPPEAQWEYAAKGAQKSQGYEYAGSNDINEVAWHRENSSRKTQPVGLLKPNELGIYDMSGNVWEWCEDDRHDNYEGIPKDGTAWIDKPRANYRVLRGGSWNYGAGNCRSADRYGDAPDYGNYLIGFRFLL